FYLIAEEVREALSVPAADRRDRAAARKRVYAAERERFVREGPAGYPPFLRGDRPDLDRSAEQSSLLSANLPERHRGQPVSPGVGRGQARIVRAPEDLAEVRPGEVLVARGADPGWTVVFDRLARLVTESGGQLS